MKHVVITDSINFYNGREAEVINQTDIGDITVYWVRVVDTNVELAIRADRVKEL